MRSAIDRTIWSVALATLACGGGERTTSRPDTPARVSGGDVVPARESRAGTVSCAPGNGGVTLPAGFCATIFADSVGGARHLAVAPNGDVFVKLLFARRGVESGAGRGGVLALRDVNGDGTADTSAYFGDLGGTGIGLHGGYIYVDAKSRIVRFPLASGRLVPSGEAQTVVEGIPTGGHDARNFTIDGAGNLYVNFGSATNACQAHDRSKERGLDPCTELERRAGIWRFRADRMNQSPSLQARFATGNRNAEGLAINPVDGKLYATQHGRDQLFQLWPQYYDARAGAENPAEELMQVSAGDDFGWPYCYYDLRAKQLVLAPEYGGNGTTVGRCARTKAPVTVFPGHWAPMSLLFYTGTQFPAKYRGGAFIAFHGSWNRAPEPQAGFRVVFVPMKDGRAAGDYETFADGFAGAAAVRGRNDAAHRPVGLAQAPDGSIYITDDKAGRIWKVVYRP